MMRANYWRVNQKVSAKKACRQAQQIIDDAPPSPPPTRPMPIEAVNVVRVSERDRGRICRAAIALLMVRDPASIRVLSDDGEVVRVGYRRDDGTVWRQQCRVSDDGRLQWAGIEGGSAGRWHSEDELSYQLVGAEKVRIALRSGGTILDAKSFVVR